MSARPLAGDEPTLPPPTAQPLQNKVSEEDFVFEKPPPLSRIDSPTHCATNAQRSDSDTSSSNSSDDEQDFDWFAEEDTKSKPGEQIFAKRGRWLWLAFMKLARPVRVILTMTLGTGVLITPFVVARTRFRDSPHRVQAEVWSIWFTTIWLAGWATDLLTRFVPRIFLAIASCCGARVEKLKIEVELMMAVDPWLKLGLDIAWTWISLSVIRTIFQPPGAYWVIVNRFMQAAFAAGIILFVEKLFLHFVAINFHQKALADRIAENQLGLKALDYLSNAQPNSAFRRTAYPKRTPRTPGMSPAASGVSASPTNKEDRQRSIPDPKPFPVKNPQPKRKKKVTTIIVDQVGGAIGQVMLKDSKFNKGVDLTGLYSARKLARNLFSALSNADPPRSHLTVDDFYPYFPTTAEAHEAFSIFDKDNNGDISKREMREAVQRIYKDSKALVAGLKDVGSIVAKLDAVLLCVALVVIVFICLLIFNRSNTIASLVPLATIILGFSFIFGNSAQTLFNSLIFIFSTHVFDVGDLVMIDDQILFVKEFGLFSTVFRRVDGQEVIAPNALLANEKLVYNLRRSKSMWESTTLTVSYSTPLEVLERLKCKIADYISTNSRDWSSFAVNIDKMEFQNALHLIVAIEHRPNWQDWGGRWTRRTAFMRYLKTVLEELEIHYTMPVQPVLLPSAVPDLRTPTGPTTFLSPPPMGRDRRQTADSEVFGNAGFYRPQERPQGAFVQSAPPTFDRFA